VLSTETAFTGSLAFGLTSCDPIHVPASRLPIDTDELMERPEYWVSIKDVAASPAPFDILTFSIDSTGVFCLHFFYLRLSISRTSSFFEKQRHSKSHHACRYEHSVMGIL
jgi:hypothetical protein